MSFTLFLVSLSPQPKFVSKLHTTPQRNTKVFIRGKECFGIARKKAPKNILAIESQTKTFCNGGIRVIGISTRSCMFVTVRTSPVLLWRWTNAPDANHGHVHICWVQRCPGLDLALVLVALFFLPELWSQICQFPELTLKDPARSWKSYALK